MVAGEYDRFEELTRTLVNTPKPEKDDGESQSLSEDSKWLDIVMRAAEAAHQRDDDPQGGLGVAG